MSFRTHPDDRHFTFTPQNKSTMVKLTSMGLHFTLWAGIVVALIAWFV